MCSKFFLLKVNKKAADELLLCRNPPHRQELFVSDYKASVQQEQFREGLRFFRSATLALNLSESQAETESGPGWRPAAWPPRWEPGVRTPFLPPELRPGPARAALGARLPASQPPPRARDQHPRGTEYADRLAAELGRARQVRAEPSNRSVPGGTQATVRSAG